MPYTAGQVTQTERKLLKDTGFWLQFVEERGGFKATGMPAKDAKREALAIWIPKAEMAKKLLKTPAAIGVSGAGKESSGSEPSLIIPDNVLNSPHDAVASIEYVAKYLEIGLSEDNIKDAPCAAAVSMLRSYSTTNGRKDKFWDDIHIKLIAKSDLEKKEKELYDGELIQKMSMEIVEQMEKFKEKEYVES